MRVYQKDINRTANAIAEVIKRDKVATQDYERISKGAYDWLYMNANSLASFVEKLLDYTSIVAITREKEYGEYFMRIDWYRV